MSDKKNSKSPGRFLYFLVIGPMTLIAKYMGVKVVKNELKGYKGPFAVIANHLSPFDFIYSYAVVRRRMNTVAAEYYYRNPKLKSLLEWAKCIRREQFRSDPASIMAMKRIVKNGGSVLIFPEGELNSEGRNYVYPESISKLVKFLGVPVFNLHYSGGHIAFPKWGGKIRRGTIQASITLCLTGEQLKTLADKEIEDVIAEAIRHDEYDWQEKNMIPFKGEISLKGLENTLYKCCRCSKEFNMASEGKKLICRECGNTVYMDEYGFLNPQTENDVAIKSTSKWCEMEYDSIVKEAEDPAFRLEAPSRMLLFTDGIVGKPAGEGIISLSSDSLTYAGTRHGERIKKTYNLENIFKLPFACGENFEVPNTEEHLAFTTDNPQMIFKFALALPAIREARNGGKK